MLSREQINSLRPDNDYPDVCPLPQNLNALCDQAEATLDLDEAAYALASKAVMLDRYKNRQEFRDAVDRVIALHRQLHKET